MSVSFNVVINGIKVGYFIPTRGIRQGDPLSPYLLLLVVDVLSKGLLKAAEVGQIK